MTTTDTSHADPALWARSTRSYGCRPSNTEPAWVAIDRAVGDLPRGSLVLVAADQPHLARVLCLNLVNHRAVDGSTPTLFFEPGGPRPDSRAIVEANVHGVDLAFTLAPAQDDLDDLMQERAFDAVNAAPWVQCQEPDAWLPRLDSIVQHRGLNLDVQLVIIDSLADLGIHDVEGVPSTANLAHRILFMARALKRLAQKTGVTIAAGCPSSLEASPGGPPVPLSDLASFDRDVDLVIQIGESNGRTPSTNQVPQVAATVPLTILRPPARVVARIDCLYEAERARFLAPVHEPDPHE